MTDSCALKDIRGGGMPTVRKWGGPLSQASRGRQPLSKEDQVLEAQVRDIISRGPSGKGALIPLLQMVQQEVGYLPKVSIGLLSARLGVPESRIYGVVTFYAQFHLKPRGKYIVRVCQGTACHVRGGKIILQAVEDQLGIKPGDTTGDLLFTLERVACLGACGLAPTMIVNDDTYGRLTPAKAQKILDNLAKGTADEAAGS
jgi:NADH-quinone oxidoreductase E subunit